MLTVNNLSKTLGTFSISNITFNVESGEYFVLLGASGVGKTILLETIAGMISPDSGEILIDGEKASIQSKSKPLIGLVYQDQALFPHMTVRQNIEYGLKSRLFNKSQIYDRVNEMANEVQITDLLDRKPDTLSGGESQRVALARALVLRPKLLLCDEPLSSIDTKARAGIRSILRKLNRIGITILHVTHDYEEAISLASRIAIMENGTISQTGIPQDIFLHPKSEFVARFTGIKNFYQGTLVKSEGKDGKPIKSFVTDPLQISVTTNEPPGNGFVTIRSEDITLSFTPPETSARNSFQGTIIDTEPARNGLEIIVDIGVEIASLITEESKELMDLSPGKKIWVAFKATAVRFIPE